MCLQVVGATFPTSLIVIASFRVSESGLVLGVAFCLEAGFLKWVSVGCWKSNGRLVLGEELAWGTDPLSRSAATAKERWPERRSRAPGGLAGVSARRWAAGLCSTGFGR